jgi:hypothetical protein
VLLLLLLLLLINPAKPRQYYCCTDTPIYRIDCQLATSRMERIGSDFVA